MIKGKALLVLTRLHEHDEDPRYEVSSFIQSCSGDCDHRDAVNEEFQHLAYDVIPVPNQARRLQPGETMRIAVVYAISYYRYDDGEVDSDLEYSKARVLRHQKAINRYVRKSQCR